MDLTTAVAAQGDHTRQSLVGFINGLELIYLRESTVTAVNLWTSSRSPALRSTGLYHSAYHPRGEVIKWLTSLYNPSSLWTSFTLTHKAANRFILCLVWTFARQQPIFSFSFFVACVFPWNCPTKHSAESPQGNHDWNPSVTNGIIFLASSLTSEPKAEHCFGKHSPVRCPLLLLFVSLSLQQQRGGQAERGRAKRMNEKNRKKSGVSLLSLLEGFQGDCEIPLNI